MGRNCATPRKLFGLQWWCVGQISRAAGRGALLLSPVPGNGRKPKALGPYFRTKSSSQLCIM